MIQSHSRSEISSNGRNSKTPAELTSVSSPPIASAARAMPADDRRAVGDVHHDRDGARRAAPRRPSTTASRTSAMATLGARRDQSFRDREAEAGRAAGDQRRASRSDLEHAPRLAESGLRWYRLWYRFQVAARRQARGCRWLPSAKWRRNRVELPSRDRRAPQDRRPADPARGDGPHRRGVLRSGQLRVPRDLGGTRDRRLRSARVRSSRRHARRGGPAHRLHLRRRQRSVRAARDRTASATRPRPPASSCPNATATSRPRRRSPARAPWRPSSCTR